MAYFIIFCFDQDIIKCPCFELLTQKTKKDIWTDLVTTFLGTQLVKKDMKQLQHSTTDEHM